MWFFKKNQSAIKKNRVKEFRIQKGLTEKELAKKIEELSVTKYNEKIHLHYKTIIAIENNRYIPSSLLSSLISEVLKRDFNEIFN